MQFGLGVPTDRDFADPARLVQLAVDAEEAGWDGFFVWDHLVRRQPWQPILDPWGVLGAVAHATSRIRIGTAVTPLPRRRPQVVARHTATLDQLSGGRFVLGVGLGAPEDEFWRFGEDPDAKVRAAKLDEGLELLDLLWTGEEVTYEGEHHRAEGVRFEPIPVDGHVPVWVAGRWPAKPPFRRAARWDGVYPVHEDPDGSGMMSVEQAREIAAFVGDERERLGRTGSFDVVIHAVSPDDPDQATERATAYADAGVTWWNELLERPDASFEQMRDRVLQGPPRP